MGLLGKLDALDRRVGIGNSRRRRTRWWMPGIGVTAGALIGTIITRSQGYSLASAGVALVPILLGAAIGLVVRRRMARRLLSG